MTHISHPIRPARAAIAAVLALTATPLLAQEAPVLAPSMPQPQAVQPAGPAASVPTLNPQVQMPATQPAAPPPITSAPAASMPAMAMPGDPVPMAMPAVPPLANETPVTRIAPPADVTESATPVRRAAPAERQAARTNTPSARATAATPQPAASPEPLATAPVEENAELAPVAPVASTNATPAQQSAAIAETGNGNGDVWAWMAGLIALLGIGGGAIALRNGRTRNSAHASAAAPLAVQERAPNGGITTPVPAPSTARLDQPVMTAAVMTGSRTTERTARPDIDDTMTVDERRLESMIAQRPTRDNPFVTRANRKRRATFLLRNSYPMQSAA